MTVYCSVHSKKEQKKWSDRETELAGAKDLNEWSDREMEAAETLL